MPKRNSLVSIGRRESFAVVPRKFTHARRWTRTHLLPLADPPAALLTIDNSHFTTVSCWLGILPNREWIPLFKGRPSAAALAEPGFRVG